MARLLIVAYRPRPGKRKLVLPLMRGIYRAAKRLDLFESRPLLGWSAEGHLIYIAMVKSTEHIDHAWEDEEYQDLSAQLATVADLLPLQTLSEASASFINLQGLLPGETGAVTG